METLDHALIVPPQVRAMIQWGGVFTSDGTYCHRAALWRTRRPILLEPESKPEPVEHIEGRWLWGGSLLNHFGHFLTESTVRLWALDHIPRPDGIIFMFKRGGSEPQPLHTAFFEALGVADIPIRIVSTPTTVEQLVVPGQGFGIGPMSVGTNAFKKFITNNFFRDVAADGPKRLYISRSALGPRKGGLLAETLLETRLRQDGYEIFHPQKHPLSVQVAHYRAAQEVIAPDGSALHLLAFSGRPGTKVAMIQRRRSTVSHSIARHVENFLDTAPMVLENLSADWVRTDRKRADRFSIGELDFPGVGQALADAGFVDTAAGFDLLSDADRQAAIDIVHSRSSYRFERRAHKEAKQIRKS